MTDSDIVDINAAGDAAFARNEFTISSGRCRLARPQHILEPPQHIEAARPQRLSVGPQSLTLFDQPLVGADAAVHLATDEEQSSGLIGRERKGWH